MDLAESGAWHSVPLGTGQILLPVNTAPHSRPIKLGEISD